VILLVDDSQLVLQIAKAYLSADYQVTTASSGEEGMAKALAQRPDLILMDFHMPGGDGPEIGHRLAQDDRTKGVPVIIMTTESEVDRLAPGLDYIVKPFGRAALLRKIGSRIGPGASAMTRGQDPTT
jgi:twitching motility two-component system response regulator PilH